jgi:DNA repair exonuclease SbcCD ATPase subunit
MSDARDVELEKVKAKLQTNQDSILSLQTENAGIQAQITILEKKMAEIQKATAGYDKAAADMTRELDDYKALISRKHTIAEITIRELKEPIEKKILDFDKNLADRDKAVTTATDNAAQAAADSDKAILAIRDKESAYTALQNQPKTLETKLKDLKVLIDQVAKAEAQDDFVAMYFYLREAALQAEGIVIPTPDDYKKQLVAGQSQIEAATTEAAAKKAGADTAATATVDAKKAYDTALASRRSDLLKVLHEVEAKVPARSELPAQPGSTSFINTGTAETQV